MMTAAVIREMTQGRRRGEAVQFPIPITSHTRPLVVIVDRDPAMVSLLQNAVADIASTCGCCDFITARYTLKELAPTWLVSNLRLGMYNGLHLVYLSKSLEQSTRCIVYTNRVHVDFVRETQLAGAFFERAQHMRLALPAYIRGTLPAADRRTFTLLDRRSSTRGGRRASDVRTRARRRARA
jgi:hypothetical protein